MDTREKRSVEIVAGNGTKHELALEPGALAVWCVAADGTLRRAGSHVEEARLLLRVDGERLFAATQWEEIRPPALLAAGGMRIVCGHGSSGMSALMSPAAERLPEFDDDETHVGPPPCANVPRAPAPSAREMIASLRSHGPQSSSMAAASTVVRPDAKSPEVTSRPGPDVRFSPVRIGILVMAIITVVIATGSWARKIPLRHPAGETTLSTARAALLPAVPSPRPQPGAEVSVSPATPPFVAAAPAAGESTTDERAAVMAVESGAYDRAARLYDALGTSHPDRPAYRAAASILRAKSAGAR